MIGQRTRMVRLIFPVILVGFILVPYLSWAEEKVTFAFFARGWPPFEMVVDGEPKGAAVDLFKALMPKDIDAVVEMMPAPRIFLKIQGKPVFGRLTAKTWMGPEFNCLWSDPVITINSVLYSSANKPVDYSGLESLKGLTIGCVKNYVYPEIEKLFKEDEAVRYDVNDDILLLRMVKAGRVDVAVFDDISAAWMVSKASGMTAADFHVAKKLLGRVDLRFAFNRDESWKKRLPALNRTIRKRRVDGTIDEIMVRYK